MCLNLILEYAAYNGLKLVIGLVDRPSPAIGCPTSAWSPVTPESLGIVEMTPRVHAVSQGIPCSTSWNTCAVMPKKVPGKAFSSGIRQPSSTMARLLLTSAIIALICAPLTCGTSQGLVGSKCLTLGRNSETKTSLSLLNSACDILSSRTAQVPVAIEPSFAATARIACVELDLNHWYAAAPCPCMSKLSRNFFLQARTLAILFCWSICLIDNVTSVTSLSKQHCCQWSGTWTLVPVRPRFIRLKAASLSSKSKDVMVEE